MSLQNAFTLLPEKKSFVHCLKEVQICCEQAHNAVGSGRICAARGLYMTAKTLFDSAFEMVQVDVQLEALCQLQDANSALTDCANCLGFPPLYSL